jgi:ADP-ribose pyrophosphatase YjhB (NUDIX family)
MASSSLSAVVTAGGTRQPIDDIRGVDNISSGRFGIEIARALAKHDVDTTLLGSKRCFERLRSPEDFEARQFVTFKDLQTSLYDIIDHDKPSLIFMAAAVSDYSPVPIEGKIRSDQDELHIKMKRNPKILSSLRERAGVQTFLTGFKLLSGVSDSELVETALKQVKGARTNLAVANDLKKIDFARGFHPVVLVTPEGGTIALDGSRSEVADSIVEFVLKRNDVHWFRTTVRPGFDPAPFQNLKDAAGDLLQMAQDARLLIDTNGNISYRGEAQPGSPQFFVSPRQKDKATITADDLSYATVNLDDLTVLSEGAHKSSIDTGVQGLLYAELPQIESLLHFHPGDVMVLSDGEASFPFPCGTVEEADQVLSVLDQMRLQGNYSGDDFLIEMPHHGYLLGLEHGGSERIIAEWNAAKEGYAAHLQEIGEPEATDQILVSPIFLGSHIVGVIGKHEEGWHTLWLDPAARSQGTGYSLTSQLIERGITIGAHDNCGVKEYYFDRGYKQVDRRDNISLLIPPTQRDDLREAASVALVNPDTREILLGRRLTDPWKGFHSFPGGGTEAEESELEAALRELHEETGLTVRRTTPIATSIHYAGWNDGEKAYRIKNHIILTGTSNQPTPSNEMSARWVSLDEALDFEMGQPTKSVIRQVKLLLDQMSNRIN